MDTLIQADIFFFITTVITIVVGIILAVALVYVVSLLKDFKYIVKIIREGTDALAQDIHDLRREAKKEGLKVKSLLSFTDRFTNVVKSVKKTQKSKSKSKK